MSARFWAPPSRFIAFGTLYMTATLLELAERLRHPAAAAAGLVLIVAVLATGVTRTGFLVFLAATTGWFLWLVPDVANHVNIAIYCNVVMMTGIGWSLARRPEYPTDEDVFELLRPVLQVSLVLVYLFAGFAKLNSDFLDPAVSCVGSMASQLARLRGSTVAGLPTPLLVLAGAAVAGDRLLASAGRPRPSQRVLAGSVAVLLLLAVLVATGGWPAPSPRVVAGLVLAATVMVLAWELVGGPLLAVPAFQAPVLAFSWSMHATLALIGFVDFSALALALLFTFLPPARFEELRRPIAAPFLGRRLPRLHAFFGLCLVAGLFSAADRRFPAGVFFNLAALTLLWPVLVAAAGRWPALEWGGVPLRSARTPRWMLAFPVLILLHGLTAYAGLRTAGNFTMFSNLRTEGERSNHLLLGGNPLKRWGYQEDVVRFIRIDDREAAIGYHYQPLEGNRLPVVEFRKLIHRWTEAGRAVPMTYEYAGQVRTTDDITREPAWRSAGRDWEMRLMDFRVIQGEGANRCRW